MSARPVLDGNQPHNPARDKRRNVEINVGKRCNFKCVFCLDGQPSDDQRAFLSWGEMRAELDRYHAAGHRSVGFLGGEPTIYPHIVESTAYARDLGFTRIAVATNAIRFRKAAFTDAMLAAGLTRVTISMHGHTEALEDRQSQVPGGFQKKCAAIRALVAHRRAGRLRDGVAVNLVLNGWNYRALPRMLRFFYDDLGLDDLRVNFVRPEGHAQGSTELTPRYTDVVPVLAKAIVLAERHFQKVFTFGGFPMCVLPRGLIESEALLRRYMGEYRDLSTDCSIKSEEVPEDFTDGVSETQDGRSRFNWQDRKRFDLKHAPSACAACTRRAVCEGVWRAYLDIHGDAELVAFTR